MEEVLPATDEISAAYLARRDQIIDYGNKLLDFAHVHLYYINSLSLH